MSSPANLLPASFGRPASRAILRAKYIQENNMTRIITEQQISEDTELVTKIKSAVPVERMTQEQALEWLRNIQKD